MNPITSFIKRYPQGVFWGLNWATWPFGWYMASKFPSDLWFLFIYFPFLIGILITAIVNGRSGLKTFFSRIVRWRVGLRWYAVALFLPPGLRLVAAGLNILLGAQMPTNIQIPTGSELLANFLFPNFLLIALGEEPGFRGFALPRLLVGRSALSASLILGVLHAIWHIPLFIFGSDSPMIVPIVISGAVLNTWLFNKTNGSVLLAMLLHVMLVIVFVGMAILLPVLFGKELGRKPEASTDTLAAEQPAMAR